MSVDPPKTLRYGQTWKQKRNIVIVLTKKAVLSIILNGTKCSVNIRDAPECGFYYPVGYRISRIVKNYPAGLFGRIVVL